MFNGLDELEDFASRLAPLTPEEEEAARQRNEAAASKAKSVLTPIRNKVVKQAALKPAPTVSSKKPAVPPPAPVSAHKVVEIALSKAANQTFDSKTPTDLVSEFVGPLLPDDWQAKPSAGLETAPQPAVKMQVNNRQPVKAPVMIDMTIPPEPEKSYLKYALMASGLLIAMMSAVLFF